MRVTQGGWWKNGSWVVHYAWPEAPQSFSDTMDRKVSSWMAKNERAMARSRPHHIVKMVLEEFPELCEVECRSHPGGYGVFARGNRE